MIKATFLDDGTGTVRVGAERVFTFKVENGELTVFDDFGSALCSPLRTHHGTSDYEILAWALKQVDDYFD